MKKVKTKIYDNLTFQFDLHCIYIVHTDHFNLFNFKTNEINDSNGFFCIFSKKTDERESAINGPKPKLS